MANLDTLTMLEAYRQVSSPPPRYFTGMFRTPPVNFYRTKKVKWDIERDDEHVAITVVDLKGGYRKNTADIFTSKEATAPVFQESYPIDAFDVHQRQIGRNPYEDPEFQADIISASFSTFAKVENKIRRAIELMCADLMQTGIITLVDAAGNALYSIDFNMKGTHKPTVGTLWLAGGADPLADILAAAELNRDDGLAESNEVHFGADAWEAFKVNTKVLQQWGKDGVRIFQGENRPTTTGAGGTRQGSIGIGDYRFELFTYGGRYKDIQTGNKLRYLDKDKVIVKPSDQRLDLTFGDIPRLLPPREELLRFFPSGRMQDGENGMDLHTAAWGSPDGQQIEVGIGSRPLPIPTAIDQHSTLTVL